MTPDVEEPRATRPEPRSVVNKGMGQYRPDELSADLAAAKMAGDVFEDLGTPSFISKNFGVWYGICRSLHDSNVYDCSLRISLYHSVEANSVNVDGRYFERLWAYMMKPKYVIQGIPFGQPEEEKESVFGRIANWWRGGKSDDTRYQPKQ
jgi:hypothetical protein